MTGLYSPINKLMEQVTRPKGTGAEYMAELQKKPGYKPAEAEDRDLQALMALPQMQRAEFMEKLKGQANKFPLKHRELTGGQTHHETYTLPGGENYREILLHTPKEEHGYQTPNGAFFTEQDLADPVVRKTAEKVGLAPHTRVTNRFEGVPHHFGGMPNILASIRVKDRITPEGKKMLHIEEIQSDWHQQGRENGYRTPEMEKEIKDIKAWKKRLQNDLRNGGYGMSAEEHEEASEALRKADDELYNLEEDLAKTVPRGPHAKDWHELALKAMIQHAAENGYDQIGITPGAEQAKRFGLSKQVGSVSYNPENKLFQAFKPNRETITREFGADPERVQALIGKEAAAKLLQAPKTMGHHYLEGEDLDIGGEGMKGFYDRMVPSFLNKFGKKHGVQVQQGALTVPDEVSMGAGAKANMGDKVAPVHTFDITPQMREDVLKNGIPRYEDGGTVEALKNTASQNDAYQKIAQYLENRDAMPDIQISSNMPEGTNGMFSSVNFPIGSGQLKINPITPKQVRPSVLTHEMAHAADRQMMQQAMEQSMFGNSNQFTDAYKKMVGPEGQNRTQLARELNPDWASDNRLYRALPQEIAAHGVGAFAGPNMQDRAPKHVDATAATEFQILLDLAQRNVDKGPKGLAKIPAFFAKIGKYNEGGNVSRETIKDKVTIQPSMDVMQYELINRKAK